MALSIGGAIKAVIVNAVAGLNGQVYRDIAPDPSAMPYAVIHEQMADIPALEGDSRVIYRRQPAQVTLWQTAAAEDLDLKDSLVHALDGADVTPGAGVVLHCQVENVQRIYEPTDSVVAVYIDLHLVHSTP